VSDNGASGGGLKGLPRRDGGFSESGGEGESLRGGDEDELSDVRRWSVQVRAEVRVLIASW
jgi:hypothetical protein